MSNFRRNVAQIASGTVVSQAVVLLMTPVLTRVLGPASFGGIALFTSMYALLAGVFTLKYEQAIILPQEEQEAAGLTALTIQLSGTFSGVALVAMVLAVAFDRLHAYWICLPVATLLAAVYSAAQQWAARQRNYAAYSSSLVVGAFVNVSVGLSLALIIGDTAAALVLGFLSGLLTSVVFVLIRQHPMILRRVAAMVRNGGRSLYASLSLIKRYPHFPVHVLPTSLATGATSYAPPMVLAAVYSLDMTGYYAIATKFVLLPSVLLGGAISEAFRAEFMARMREHAALAGFTRTLLLRLFVSAVPVCIVMAWLAPWAFGFVFGERYDYAGVLVRYVMPGALGILIAQPFQGVFIGLGRSGVGLALQLTASVGPLLVLYVSALHSPIEQALLWHGVALFILSLVTAITACRLTIQLDRRENCAHA